MPGILPPVLHDFRNFLFLTWQHLRLPEPTRLQYDVAWWLQHGPDRLCIECWRGFGKSYLLSTFNTWQLAMNVDERVLNVSAAKTRADDTTRFMLRLIGGMPEIHKLRPEENQRSSSVQFDVGGATAAHQPSVRSLGILSNMIQGSRASQINADDVETKKNSQTPMMRQRVREATEELDGAIILPGPGHKVVFLGTPQIEESFYHTLAERGYTTLIYPALYPTRDLLPVYGDKLAPILREDLEKNPYLAGTPVEPERFGERVLAQRRKTYRGSSGFALQFLLLPTLAHEDRYPLRLRDLIVMDLQTDVGPERAVWTNDRQHLLPELPCVGFTGDGYYRNASVIGDFVPYQSGCMAIDPAGRGKDELAWAVVKTLNGQAFLLELRGELGGYEEGNLEKIARSAKKHDVRTVVVEKNWGGGMFSRLLEPVMAKIHPQCRIEEVSHYTRKESRILETLEPVFQAHRLVVDYQVLRDDYDSAQRREDSLAYQFAFQATRLMDEKDCLRFSDRLEAVAMACRFLADAMSRDAEREMALREQKAADEDLVRFMESVHGRRHQLARGRTTEPSWLNHFYERRRG